MTALTAFTKSRPESNLLATEEFSLEPALLRQGFMGVFNKSYSGDARKQLIKVALGAITDTRSIPLGKPRRPTSEEDIQSDKGRKAQLKTFDDNRSSEQLFKLTELRKVSSGDEPHFILSLPIVKAGRNGLDHVMSLMGGVPLSPEARAEFETLVTSNGNQLFPTRLALGNTSVDPKLEAALTTCLKGVRIKSFGGVACFYLELVITQAEAEYLVSTEWIEIRPVDLYPMLSMWVSAEYVSKFYGKRAISVSKIAATLPPHAKEDVRVDEFGIAIDMDGAPIYIPEVCDNTSSYENKFASVGSNSDGSFSMGSLEPDTHMDKASGLPLNKPILSDWINRKFSYTNSNGRIEVLDLDHMRKCTPSMALNLMHKTFSFNSVLSWTGYAEQAAVSTKLRSYLEQSQIEIIEMGDTSFSWAASIVVMSWKNDRTIKETCVALENASKQSKVYYPRLLDMCDDHALRWVHDFGAALYRGILDNLEAVYAKYAVKTITHGLGWMALLAGYGRDTSKVRLDAHTSNKAALEQNIDPNWTPPDAPLISKRMGEDTGGLLPHQAKVRNLLKDSPPFAVLSVAAGGGKSMLSITDILYEIKANRSSPYLIMCPSHLVANYVSELVEFTDGGVNVIPVTSANIRGTGYKRYDSILEAAPINTVVVVDYEVLKFRAKTTTYGTTAVYVFPVVEMLRKFKPGYVMMDECHLLKNSKSARFKTVMSLIADIPKKRIASGTLNPDSPSDLPAQIALMDPTIFGTKEQFNEMFAAGEHKGGRVAKWKDNAGELALGMLKQNVVWAEARRREWAAALPPRTDNLIPVELTDRQREVYDALFDDMVLSIRKKAATDKNAKKLLDKLTGKKASDEDEDAFGDLGEADSEGSEEDLLDDENDVGAGLQPYLAGLEQFVTDPGSHPYAQNGWVSTSEDGREVRHPALTGDDLKAPKALAIEALMKQWFATRKSKIIIFTNYLNSAESLFKAMPPELQSQGILYRASEKTEIINKFRNDPNVKWLIGIRKSMEVGLNLQKGGYLIRVEGVWNPGEQEQGDSRIERPYFGPGGDTREELRFDTIVADRTIDVTKAARLRAKMIANAKFDNAKDPAYQAIEAIPVFKMTLDNIRSQNDFNDNLTKYRDSMNALNQVIKADYAEYRAKIEAEGGFKFTQIQKAPTPAEARLLSHVPYAHGTELYNASGLGLVRVDNYLGMELSADEEEEDDSTTDDSSDTDEVRQQRALLIGKRCHIELGEGEIVSVRAKNGKVIRVMVKLDDGTTASRVHVTQAFVATRTETNSIDMRNAIAKAAGLDVTAPITVPAENQTQTRVTQKELKEKERQAREAEREAREAERKAKKGKKQLSVALHLSIMNGYMRLGYTPTNESAAKALQAIGFKQDQPYVYTLLRSAQQLIKQAQAWQAAGFNTSKEVDNDGLALLHRELATGALRSHRHYVKTVSEGAFGNYIRKNWRPNADKKLLNLFALITDGGGQEGVLVRKAEKDGTDAPYAAAYLCLPLGGGFPGTMEAIKPQYKAPGTNWMRSEDELSMFVSGFNAVRKVLIDLAAAGIMVSNGDELNKQARNIKKASEAVKVDGLDLSDNENWNEKEPTGKAGSNKAKQAEDARKAKQLKRK